MFKSEVTQIKIGFTLPTWYPPARLDINSTRRWYDNKALNTLYRLKGCIETGDGYVVFEIQPGANINQHVKKIKGKIDRLIKRYKEAQEGEKTP